MCSETEKLNNDDSVSDAELGLDLQADEIDETLKEADSKIVEQYPEDSFIKFLIRQEPPTYEENNELIRRIQAGDEKAKNEFLIRNGRLAITLVNRLAPAQTASLDMDDMLQQAFLGMMKAVERFDTSLNIKFSTYAYQWIRQSLWRYFSNANDTIRIPVHMRATINKINRIKNNCIQECKPIPTDKELAQMLHITVESVVAARQASESMVSLDSKIDNGNDGTSTLGDFITADNNVEDDYMDSRLAKDVRDALANSPLSDKEIFVLSERYGLLSNEPKTLEQVGAQMGVTRERVRQIEMKALAKLSKTHAFKELAAGYLNIDPKKREREYYRRNFY